MIGSTISHYRILEKIGEGGMGVVYKAEDLRLKRPVALKFLHDKGLNEVQRRRFLREAQASAALEHPNICTIYEVDEAEGQVFLAMAFLEGDTLAERIDGGSIEIPEAIRVGSQIASALDAAHQQGVVHRDVKAGNVIIGLSGRAYILDFGLAQVGGRSRITRTGVTVGTAAYMSPEQAQGVELDGRSDIWSLGVLLYEMTCGRLPFRGEHELAMMYNIVNEEPTALAEYRPDAPAALGEVIDRCLRKSPADRYQTAGEAAEDLRLASDKATRGEAPTVSEIRPQYPRKTASTFNPSLAAAAVLLILLAVLISWQAMRAPAGSGAELPTLKHLVVLPFETIGTGPGSQALGDGIVETLTGKLTELEQFQGDLMVVPSSEVRAQQVVSVSEARRLFGVNLAVTGSLQRTDDRIRLTANLVDAEALRQLRSTSVSVSEQELANLQDGVVQRIAGLLEIELNVEARNAISAGGTSEPQAYERYLEGLGYLRRSDRTGNIDLAVESLEASVAADPDYAPPYSGLAEAYWRRFINTGEPVWSDRAMSNARRAVELNPRLAVSQVKLGELLTRRGQNTESEAHFRTALQLDPLNAEARRGLGRVYRETDRIDEAEALYRQAIELQPENWNNYYWIATFYSRQARYDKAEKALLRALEITPNNPAVHRNLGGIYILQGRYALARSELQRSIEIQPHSQSYGNLGSAEYFEGRFEQAAQAYERAIELGGTSYTFWGNLAEACRWTTGRQAQSREAFEKALSLARKRLASAPRDVHARSRAALYGAKLGRSQEALEELARVPVRDTSDARIPFIAAEIHELAGDRDRALDSLAEALARGHSVAEIAAEPDLRDLRSDPRFEALIDRLR